MADHFFFYSTPDQVLIDRESDLPYTHAGSEQFGKISTNDTIWIVTVDRGELFLIAKLVAGQKTNRDNAIRLLGTDNIIDKSIHVIAKRGTAQKMKMISLTDIIHDLRFKSETGKDRLSLSKEAVIAKQLQTIRRLELESARLLERIWTQKNSPLKAQADVPATCTDIGEPPQRVESTIIRTIRDTAKARDLKNRYKYRCQVCGTSLGLSEDKYYAEVHHIRPLGSTHEGFDEIGNMLVLCPNHHALFDFGVPEFISPQSIRIGRKYFKLTFLHSIDKRNLEYHNEMRGRSD
jgi:predicted HNH restriction endonuclease